MDARYVVVDVFTSRPLAGNPLAVFPDADGVPPELMQAVARELNLSETTFVIRGGDRSYDVRIFTPDQEMPFAGHPTLGTAWVLRSLGRIAGDEVVQRTPAGETRVHFEGDRVWLARPGSVGEPLADRERIARVLGIGEQDVGWSGVFSGRAISLPPALSDAGILQLMVPLARPEAVARVRPGPHIGSLAHHGVYCFSPLSQSRVKARFFAPGAGVFEDPATGSAAAALGLYLGRAVGRCAFDITQGEELRRPSRILVESHGDTVRVGGSVVRVAEGTLSI